MSPFEPEYQTSSLNVATDFEDDFCGGNLAVMDEFVHYMDEHLGGAGLSPIWVLMYIDGQELGACPVSDLGSTSGCWDEPIVHTTWVSVSHELVHAYMSEMNPQPLPYLQEGLAEAISGDVEVRVQYDYNSIKSHFLDTVAQPGWYQESGHFVRWMISEFGHSAIVDLYVRARLGVTVDELSVVTEAVFGESLDSLIVRYLAESNDYYPGLGPFSCGEGENVEWVDGIKWQGETSCSDSIAIGRYRNDGRSEVWRRLRVDVPISGVYLVSTSSASAIIRCLTEPYDKDDLPVEEDFIYDGWSFVEPFEVPSVSRQPFSNTEILLDAGVYELWIGQDADLGDLSATFIIQRP